jgi:hypothetical protein
VFFGRSADVARLAALLRSPTERLESGVLLVVGPSGCGKSSLVRAGLLPAMAAEPGWWVLAPMLPGHDPVAALARELAAGLCAVGLGVTVAEVRRRLERGGLTDVVDDLLLAAPGPRRTRLLLVIDQFEELLTQTLPAERLGFVQLLEPAVRESLQVLATLRAEFFDQLPLSPELARLKIGNRRFAVQPLLRESLYEAIVEPARLAGISIDTGLVSRLMEDTPSGDALPLLACTLAELAEGTGRGDRLLTSRYEQLGGVQGTLFGLADAALTQAMAAGGVSEGEVLRELLRLVTVDEDGRPSPSRFLEWGSMPTGSLVALEPFVARRILMRDVRIISISHDALVWPS